MTRNQPKNINLAQNSRRVNTEARLVDYIKTQLGSGMITIDISRKQILNCIDDSFDKFSAFALDGQQNMGFVIPCTSDIQDYYIDDRITAIYGINIADSTSSYNNAGGAGISLGGFGEIGISYIPYVDLQGNVSSLETGSGSGNYSATGVAGGVTGGPATSGNPLEQMEVAYTQMVQSQMMGSMFGSSVAFDFNNQTHILRIFESVGANVFIEAALEYRPNPDFDDAYGHPWIKAYSLNLAKRVWSGNVGKYSQSLIGGATINYDKLIQKIMAHLSLGNGLLF